MPELEWSQIKELANRTATEKGLGDEYISRLVYEIKEIEKQGANNYYTSSYNEGFKYETNKNGLVMPWLLGMTTADPLGSKHQIEQQSDWPDIDCDCLPSARDRIKEYAASRYGDDKVISVGTWMTYKFRSALKDVVRAHGGDPKLVNELTKKLPDDVDDLKDSGMAPCMACKKEHREAKCPHCGSEETDGVTIGKLLADYPELASFNSQFPEVVDMAVRLVGKITNLGTHAGGLIISSEPLFGLIPMGKSGGRWISMWTEGRNTQLSKFGFVKWDILGLKTLGYIHECCKMIQRTRGIKFDPLPWSRQDREKNILGTYTDVNGNDAYIMMDDPEVFKMLNELRTETVFQFETDVQRGILSNGVRDYYDLQVFNAMGHPGPMDMIPDYVARRDDKDKKWVKDEHPDVAQLLMETFGVIVYQEDLQRLWQHFGGFTGPEAEAARKAVAKKWKDKLKPVEGQWMKGATKTLGEEWATTYWGKMIDFGRYAFNKSHSCSYIMIAFFSAWLKIHFPSEWWAAVMSTCHHDKMVKYMNIARSEGVKFGDINVEEISLSFTVDASTLTVTPGLTSIKNVGEKAVAKMQANRKYSDIDEFVAINGKNKTVLQRLIQLGAFQRYHPNIRATWMWYSYKYTDDKETRDLIRSRLLQHWTPALIEEERERQIAAFKQAYPKRKKIPKKIENWSPKPEDSRESVMALFPDDYTLKDRLKFEQDYLGYYWHSPLDLYHTEAGRTISDVKAKDPKSGGALEGVIEKVWRGQTTKGDSYAKITLSDGLNNATVIIWPNELGLCNSIIKEGQGIRIYVQYDKDRGNFTLKRNSTVHFLEGATDYAKRMESEQPEVSIEEIESAVN